MKRRRAQFFLSVGRERTCQRKSFNNLKGRAFQICIPRDELWQNLRAKENPTFLYYTQQTSIGNIFLMGKQGVVPAAA